MEEQQILLLILLNFTTSPLNQKNVKLLSIFYKHTKGVGVAAIGAVCWHAAACGDGGGHRAHVVSPE